MILNFDELHGGGLCYKSFGLTFVRHDESPPSFRSVGHIEENSYVALLQPHAFPQTGVGDRARDGASDVYDSENIVRRIQINVMKMQKQRPTGCNLSIRK